MTEGSNAVLLSIGEMIDLAIGTPEIGVVDFNMLQTILHCLAQQLRISGKNVELRGSIATLPVGRENVQTIAVSEFAVGTTDKELPKKAESGSKAPSQESASILVVERVKKSDLPPPRSPVRGETSSRRSSAVPAPGGISSTERLSLVTISKFNILEATVEDIRNRVYGSIPKNEEILQDVRSQTNLKAITDMWTSLNVSSRLEAAEAGIAKLSSLVQDIIRDAPKLQEALGTGTSVTEYQSEPPLREISASSAPGGSGGSGGPFSCMEEFTTLKGLIRCVRCDLDYLATTFYKAMEGLLPGIDLTPPGMPAMPAVSAASVGSAARIVPTETGMPSVSSVPTVPAVPAVSAEPSLTTVPVPMPSETGEGTPIEQRESEEQPWRRASTTALSDRLNDLEKRMTECCEKIDKSEGVLQDQITSFQDQLEYLLKQVATLTADLAAGKLSPDLIRDLQGLMQLFQTVQEMQAQLNQVHETALQLAAEKDDRLNHMHALLEQIELLKIVKLDREDMIEAMADKADVRMVARKVSHDQFELACDDLSKGLENAVGKLNLQEALWQQALDDIQREIETKLDKMELSPVKDFFNSKLKQLQENLKQMASLRREVEAAGTKRRLLRDVNCISCDAKAVMPMETPTLPVIKPMPANISMKPYLSYELDTIRKIQASNLPQRNMRDWETIDKQMSSKLPQKVRSVTDKHLCNRYCGGSHTVTTPAQRVARLGHFIRQWGPDVLPLSSGLAAGDDGKMYKVSTAEEAIVGPGGAIDGTATKKSEILKSPDKPVCLGAVCTCLDPDYPAK